VILISDVIFRTHIVKACIIPIMNVKARTRYTDPIDCEAQPICHTLHVVWEFRGYHPDNEASRSARRNPDTEDPGTEHHPGPGRTTLCDWHKSTHAW
jgi:hypothetical protein